MSGRNKWYCPGPRSVACKRTVASFQLSLPLYDVFFTVHSVMSGVVITYITRVVPPWEKIQPSCLPLCVHKWNIFRCDYFN